MPFCFAELQKVFLDALAVCPPDAPQQTREMGVSLACARLCSGSWFPMEQTRLPVRLYLRATGDFDTEESCIQTVERAVTTALEEVLHKSVATEFMGEASSCSDIVGACTAILRRYLLWILYGYLSYDGTPQLLFCDALKNTVRRCRAEWKQRLLPMVHCGKHPEELFRFVVTSGTRQLCTSTVLSKADRAEVSLMAATLIQVFLMAEESPPGEPFPRSFVD
ncbi:hypothetical protein JKF63_01987 [Porcisia hertigi]|uniref:Uncharacterized protein n=1 Tax=Porcisia hertigi TaxID=2761500 RepID=A0A836L1V5_9TRYP|nr:hypothetical protein JKF63_01987 [Porcisia hertigi]